MKRYNSISFGFAIASLMLGVTGCTSSTPPPPIAVEDTVVAEAPIEATVEPTDVPVPEESTATPPPLEPMATSIPAEPTDSDGVAVAETEEAAAEDVSPDAEVESPATDELIAVATIDVTYFTPAQTEGPYYPVEKPVDQDNDLTNVAGAAGSPAGQVIEFTGTVYDATGTPIEGLTVEIWQTDDNGVYLHPNDPGTEQRDRNFQFYGESTTGADGR